MARKGGRDGAKAERREKDATSGVWQDGGMLKQKPCSIYGAKPPKHRMFVFHRKMEDCDTMFVIRQLDDGMCIETDGGRNEYHNGDLLAVRMVDDTLYHGTLGTVGDAGDGSLYFTIVVSDCGARRPAGPLPCEMIESVSKMTDYVSRGAVS